MKEKLIILCTLLPTFLWSQDTQFSMFYTNPLYVNPALAGTSPDTRVGINHRILWPSLPQAFTSSSVSIDHHSEPLNSSFGFLVHKDSEGTADLNNTSFFFTYGYEAHITENLVARPALQFGHTFRGFDQSQLVFSDQIEFGLDGAPTRDPGISAIQVNSFWDFNTGILLYTRKFWTGFAVHHLTRPNIAISGGQDELLVRYSFHLGTRFPLGNKIFRGKIFPSVAPHFLYKRQGSFEQFQGGASFHLQPVIFGLYYRGMPISSRSFGELNQDAVVVQVGLDYFDFEFGYSFDISLSRLDVVNAGGAHEISLQYRFHLPYKRKKISRTLRRLPCPAFVHSLQN